MLENFSDIEKSFILHYTNIRDITYRDHIRSGIRSGMSMADGEKFGLEMMGRGDVMAVVEEIDEGNRKRSQLSREQKRQIAWGNYQSAVMPKSKEFWWTEVCKLDGDYVTKVENKSEVEVVEREKEMVYQAVRRLSEKVGGED